MSNQDFDYYDFSEVDNLNFIKVPHQLFENPKLRNMSDSAKLLYSILLDKMGESYKNGWRDQYNRTYIIYKTQKVCEALCWSRDKVFSKMAELEELGLIERERATSNSKYRIYVKKLKANYEGKVYVFSKPPEECPESTVGFSDRTVGFSDRTVGFSDRVPSQTKYSQTKCSHPRARGAKDKPKKNGFHNFSQRDYDYDALEEALFNQRSGSG